MEWWDFDDAGFLHQAHLKPGEDPYAKHNFNQVVSNKMKPDRSIPDTRNSQCALKTYETTNFPTTSVIIVYHNEAHSTLLRTVISVLQRSPAELIKEILLIDDFSKTGNFGSQLAQIKKVKAVKNTKREGLIRSRLKGAEMAKGKVIVFLDSHMEVNKDWLQPLLAHLDKNKRAFAVPVIDGIDKNTFRYFGSR